MGLLNGLSSWAEQKSAWLVLFATSLALEFTALYFQHGMGLEPCIMCIYQRTAMWGIVLASAARSFQYFHPGMYGDMTFLEFCREAADIGMDCDKDDRDSEDSGDSDVNSGSARKKSKTSTRAASG